ncbi:MAG: radical SAM protein, partial [Spirochaetaceae bacterium]|nr:radical SAM protein [Spirochaetaceae bacterium]
MKAVIAVPPIRDFYFTPHRASALGARVLARELCEIGWDVALENFPLAGKPRHIPLPVDLGHIKEFIIPGENGPLTWFTGYRRFGPGYLESAEIINALEPDAIFISSFAWAYAEEARELALAAARRMPEIPIVIGGHGPSALPEYFLGSSHPAFPDRPLFSLVVSGEIEGHGRLLTELLKEIGPADRHLDLGELPNRTEFRPVAGESIRRADRRSVAIALTRGCPRKCRFCSNHICHGREFRSSDSRLWEEEVIGAAGDSGRMNLNIEDDNILFLKKELFTFIETLRTRFPDITFSAENGLDYMLLEAVDLIRLKDSGFSQLNLSLGVLSGESSAEENRAGDPEKLEGLIRCAGEAGLPVTTHFISGLAGDCAEDILETLLFLDRLPTKIGISNFYPVPGLPGFTDPELFLKNAPRLALGSSVYPWTGSLTTAQMITAFRLARWSNFRKEQDAGRTGTAV